MTEPSAARDVIAAKFAARPSDDDRAMADAILEALAAAHLDPHELLALIGWELEPVSRMTGTAVWTEDGWREQTFCLRPTEEGTER